MTNKFNDLEPPAPSLPDGLHTGAFRVTLDTISKDISIELNAAHPQYNKYFIEISNLISKMQTVPVLVLSTSGL